MARQDGARCHTSSGEPQGQALVNRPWNFFNVAATAKLVSGQLLNIYGIGNEKLAFYMLYSLERYTVAIK